MPAVQPTALATIRRDHNAIGAVLDVLQREAARAQPDKVLLDQILTYLVAFSAVLHHPKEERFLHATLRQKVPSLIPTVTALEEEHAQAALRLQELRAALSPDRPPEAFRRQAQAYAAFELDHMAREESQLLAAALQTLTPLDWAELDAAFQADDEPLFGPQPAQRFARLRDSILRSRGKS